MKKVTDLNEKEVIHCKTEEEADAICRLMHEAGLKWVSENSYLEFNRWNEESDDDGICYRPYSGTAASLGCYAEDYFTIYPASDFLWTPKRGDKVLVSNSGLNWTERIFITEIKGIRHPYIYIRFGDESKFKGGLEFNIHQWEYMKPLPQEETVQEMTMEELEKELGRKVKIVNKNNSEE